jgi:ribosomal protein L37AE/L43A
MGFHKPRKRHKTIIKNGRERKPCKDCKKDFLPLSKWNVYCAVCQDKIQGQTPNQWRGRPEY